VDVRYRAFVSYSHADAAWAGWLHRQLEGYRVPGRLRGSSGEHGALPDRLTPIFRDREELASAGALGPQIEAALEESEALIVVCSPEAARSRWVDAEILAFKRKSSRGTDAGARIYALIVGGEPNTGDARECFPPALRFELEPDGTLGTRPTEPIAADVRPGKDGKPLALMKMLSGLLGVPLDTLRQREAQRRHRRMAALTGLALAVMLVTSFLAVQAVIARHAAERRQKQAEQLVGFMLGDLHDKLTEVSRLDILEAVNDQAMAYFASLPATDVTDESLEQRAKALVKIGNVRMDQGQMPKALESYRAAERLLAPLARRDRGNVPRQLDYADVLAYIGMTRWYQGDLDGAQAGFDDAGRVLELARRHAPDEPRLLFQLATLDNNTGHVIEGRGDFAAAAAHYRRMLASARRLVAIDPGRSDWQNELGLAHNNLGKMALLRGDLPTAVASYRADVAIEDALSARDPRNNAQAERQLISRATLGRTLALTGDLAGGIAALSGAVDEAERLLAASPEGTGFQEDVGLYTTQLARLLRAAGKTIEARVQVDRSIAVLGRMIAASPDNPGWRRELAEARTERGEQALAAGQAGEAQRLLRMAVADLGPLLKQHPDDRTIVLATAAAWLGLAACEDPVSAPAMAAASQALAVLEGQASGPDDPRLLALRAQALMQLGRRAEASALSTRLAAQGFREAVFLSALARGRAGLPRT
jgi:tetratricopeptide (TPR) repeat protein